MKAEYINPFISAALKVLSQMAFIQAKAGKPELKRSGEKASGDISAVIELSGGTQGSIGISFSKSCILAIASNMFGEQYHEINDEIVDLIGEVVNMVSGEARRELSEKGLQFKAGIPKTMKGENHIIHHHITCPTILIPFSTENGDFTIEACFEMEKFFDDVNDSQKGVEIKDHNNALIQTKFGCFLHTPPADIPIFLLKKDSQLSRPNIFLIPEYINNMPGYDRCNFLKLEVIICPECFFASNRLNYFKHGQQAKHNILQDPQFQKEILPKLTKMKMIGELPKSFYSHNRTIEQAITGFELAMYTSNALYAVNPDFFSDEPMKIGEYALKAALLSKIQLNEKREAKHLNTAFSIFRRTHNTLRGMNLFRTLYLLFVLSIYLKQEDHAKNYFVALQKRFAEDQDMRDPSDRAMVKQYIDLAKKVLSKKDEINFTNKSRKNSYLYW